MNSSDDERPDEFLTSVFRELQLLGTDENQILRNPVAVIAETPKAATKAATS